MVVTWLVVVIGFGFSFSLAFDFWKLSGFLRMLLVLRASRSRVDRVQISTNPKVARGCPRAAGVTRSRIVDGGGA